QVNRVFLCSGKIAWDLVAEREKRKDEKTAIVPVDQLYPLPAKEIMEQLGRYPDLTDLRWVQDEPANMGPWPFMALHLRKHLPSGLELVPVTRPASTSPAVGNYNVHLEQHQQLMDAAFGPVDQAR